ncbi:MAG TPA: hypothetical protein VMM83_03115 [Longimicrobiales bacterium]|nr:hypothetical protein [Longimicrobiales bacterium]
MRTIASFSVLPFVVAVLFACGESETGSEQETGASLAGSAPERLDACSLLSSEEVAEAFGVAFEEGQLTEHGTGAGESYFSTCVFSAANERADPTVSLMVRPSDEVVDPAVALEAGVEDMRANVSPDYEMEPVPELGEGAGWDPAMAELTVFRPGLMMMLGAHGGSEVRDRLVQLARTALERASR